ncbi:MAG: class I SAM-dependent methyltransferase [Patescibacteria group bacterium]|nr:class I SAM-dependent methyltransferase [Patescibacteria group bacterium]
MSHLPPEFKHLEGKVLSSRVYPEFFSLRGDERILNVGCGEGPQMAVYAGRFKSMLGVDIIPDRLAGFRKLGESLQQDVETLESNVESIGSPDDSFDVVMAIDIIEHVEHPEKLLQEIQRLLKPGGRLLITFPAMHDKFVDGLSAMKSFFTRKKKSHREGWHPDDHQHEYPVGKWIGMVEQSGLKFQRSRATTMFPPLHLYGVPRFWFSFGPLHALDRTVCSIPGVMKLGQTVMSEFVKPV